VGEASLAEVVDVPVVARVDGGGLLVPREERRVPVLQLGEDGELLRRRVADVDRLEGRVELAQRPPDQRPCADPRCAADGLHACQAHAAHLDGQPSLLEREALLQLRPGGGADDLVKGLGDQLVVSPRRVDRDRWRHRAEEVDERRIRAKALQHLLRLLRDRDVGRVLQLDDAPERLQRALDSRDELRRAPLLVAQVRAQHLEPVERAARVALLLVGRRVGRASQLDARGQRRQRRLTARRPDALLREVRPDVAEPLRHHRARVHRRHRLGGLVERVGVV